MSRLSNDCALAADFRSSLRSYRQMARDGYLSPRRDVISSRLIGFAGSAVLREFAL